MKKFLNAKTIGSEIKKLRIKKKMTQQQLAERLDLSPSAVSAYELGLAIPPPEIVYELCIIFDIHSDDLLGLENRKWLVVDELTDQEISRIMEMIDLFRKFPPK